MAIQLSTTGINTMLESFLKAADNDSGYEIKLFSNDVDLTATTSISQFQEVSGGGYTQRYVTGGSWDIANGVATLKSPQEWEFNTDPGDAGMSITVYGYYLVGTGSLQQLVIAAEKFDNGPYTITVDGDKITVDITLSLA